MRSECNKKNIKQQLQKKNCFHHLENFNNLGGSKTILHTLESYGICHGVKMFI